MTFDNSNIPITVILVDDHPVVRVGCRRLLESTPDIHVLAEAGNGRTGIILYKKHKPDVVVLDLSMKDIDGLETIRHIKSINLSARILVFSMYSNGIIVQRALAAGATGYITKQCGANHLLQAIRLVKQGVLYIDPELVSSISIDLAPEDA